VAGRCTRQPIRRPGRHGPAAQRGQRFGERLASASSPRAILLKCTAGRVHDRGFRPLYVRAQLETAGLPWTLRDLTAPKATARETGKTQLTGYLRRWWKVLGSNQRRLSRRFYRALPGIATQAIHLHEHRPGASRPMRSTAPQPKSDPDVQSCPAGADGSRDDSSVALPDRSGPACQGAALPYPISPTGAGR
jgi:hypothetical protein